MSWMSSGICMRLILRRCMWLGTRGRRWMGGLIDEAFGAVHYLIITCGSFSSIIPGPL